jgi:hypothetical protein
MFVYVTVCTGPGHFNRVRFVWQCTTSQDYYVADNIPGSKPLSESSCQILFNPIKLTAAELEAKHIMIHGDQWNFNINPNITI